MKLIKSIHRSSLTPAALVLVLGLLGATQAQAADPYGVTVSYRDLDLSTMAGAQTLYQRIGKAATKVCGYQGGAFPEEQLWRACYKGAIADAVNKVNSPLLTAVHTGRPVGTSVAMLSK